MGFIGEYAILLTEIAQKEKRTFKECISILKGDWDIIKAKISRLVKKEFDGAFLSKITPISAILDKAGAVFYFKWICEKDSKITKIIAFIEFPIPYKKGCWGGKVLIGKKSIPIGREDVDVLILKNLEDQELLSGRS